MRSIARLLIAEEVRRNGVADTEATAAIRVCEKLGRSLATLAGARGAQSLLERALVLGAREAAWLKALKVAEGGTIVVDRAEAKIETDAAAGGTVLVTTLLELLEAFIGDTLTLRLAQQVWPKAPLSGRKPGAKA